MMMSDQWDGSVRIERTNYANCKLVVNRFQIVWKGVMKKAAFYLISPLLCFPFALACSFIIFRVYATIRMSSNKARASLRSQ
jgi:hypothetical protein